MFKEKVGKIEKTVVDTSKGPSFYDCGPDGVDVSEEFGLPPPPTSPPAEASEE